MSYIAEVVGRWPERAWLTRFHVNSNNELFEWSGSKWRSVAKPVWAVPAHFAAVGYAGGIVSASPSLAPVRTGPLWTRGSSMQPIASVPWMTRFAVQLDFLAASRDGRDLFAVGRAADGHLLERWISGNPHGVYESLPASEQSCSVVHGLWARSATDMVLFRCS